MTGPAHRPEHRYSRTITTTEYPTARAFPGFELLTAFAPRTLLALARSHAEEEAYLGEEFGEAMVIQS